MSMIITDNRHYADIAAAIREQNEEEILYKPSEMANAVRALTGLNFKVVGSTTQPENPKENTIWVNTDQEITGWSFSASEPTDPIEGLVWIRSEETGGAQFDALKENAIQIQYSVVYLFAGNKWSIAESYFYQNGTWNDTKRTVLFSDGADNEAYTGGWYADIDNFNLMFNLIETPAGKKQIYTNKKSIDLTRYDKLIINKAGYSNALSNWVFYVCAGVSNGVIDKSGLTPAVALINDSMPDGENVLNISSLKGNYYIGVGVDRSDYGVNAAASWLAVSYIALEANE